MILLVTSERLGRIAGGHAIDLPGPRPLGVIGSEKFAGCACELRAHFSAHGSLDVH